MLVALKNITVKENPRKQFDDQSIAELGDSIEATGGQVLQPILLRILPDESFELVAGERRYRACMLKWGAEFEIEATARVMTDEEAAVAALTENTERMRMTVFEEADAAQKIVASFGGDMTKAKHALGWDLSKLEKRLSLCNICDEVRSAHLAKKIPLGVVELLATTKPARQPQSLAYILENKLTVEQVRDLVEQASMLLSRAIFDKTDCTNCQSNSGRQTALFETHIGEGRCTNRQCFQDKTMQRLEVVRNQLEEVHKKVVITDKAKALGAIKVVVEQVGPTQINACHFCENHGATVSSAPSDLGAVSTGMCFDSVCFGAKVAAFKEEQAKEAAQGATQAASDDGSGDDDHSAESATTDTPEKATKPAKAPKAEKPAKANPFEKMSIGGKLVDYRKDVWVSVLTRHFARNIAQAREYFIGLVFTHQLRVSSAASVSHLTKGVLGVPDVKDLLVDGSSTHGIGMRLNVEDTDIVLNQTIVSAIHSVLKESKNENEFKKLEKLFSVDICREWKVNAKLLDCLTKAEIHALCLEAGYAPTGEGETLDKVMSLKKPDLIEKITKKDGFDWTGFYPTMMQPALSSWGLALPSEQKAQTESTASNEGVEQEAKAEAPELQAA